MSNLSRLCLGMLLLLSCACGVTSDANSPSPTPTQVEASDAVEIDEYLSKFSPDTHFRLSQMQGDGNPVHRFLLRMDGALDKEKRDALEATGGIIGTEAGDVLTLSLPLRSLPDVAALPFVIYIELSTPLAPEAGEAEP